MTPPTVTEPLLDEYERLFQGRTSAYATQLPYGGYNPVLAPLDREAFRRHLEQTETYGMYLIREDNHVKCMCFDIDMAGKPREESYDVALEIRRTLRKEGIRDNAMLLEFSGSKGYHVWVFFGEWVSPLLVRDWGKRIEKMAGVSCEVYPKGDLPENGYGNLVKLPGALHKKSGKSSRVILTDDVSLEHYLGEIIPLHYREIQRLIVAKAPAPVVKKQPKKFDSDGTLLPCGEHIMEHGAGEGARNYTMYALAILCHRAGMEAEDALDRCLLANDNFDPPLPKRLVKEKVQSAYRYSNPAFDCSRDYLHEGTDPHCSMYCLRYKTSFGPARKA